MRNIKNLHLFLTSLCNSKCKTCDWWMNKEKIEIPFEIIVQLTEYSFTQNANFAILGGEFFLYSKYKETLELLNKKNLNYYLISNGLCYDRTIDTLRHIGIKNLSLSLDAYGEKHDEIRGVKGNFNKINRIIDYVNRNNINTKLRIGFTISKFNSREDLKNIIQFSKNNGVELKVFIAENSELYNQNRKETNFAKVNEELYEFEDLIDDTNINWNYLKLYKPWKEKRFRTDCDGISVNPTINFNGDVFICQIKMLKIGNIFDNTFEEIWLSKGTEDLIEEYRTCNACWMECHRKYDAQKFSKEEILKNYEAVI